MTRADAAARRGRRDVEHQHDVQLPLQLLHAALRRRSRPVEPRHAALPRRRSAALPGALGDQALGRRAVRPPDAARHRRRAGAPRPPHLGRHQLLGRAGEALGVRRRRPRGAWASSRRASTSSTWTTPTRSPTRPCGSPPSSRAAADPSLPAPSAVRDVAWRRGRRCRGCRRSPRTFRAPGRRLQGPAGEAGPRGHRLCPRRGGGDPGARRPQPDRARASRLRRPPLLVRARATSSSTTRARRSAAIRRVAAEIERMGSFLSPSFQLGDEARPCLYALCNCTVPIARGMMPRDAGAVMLNEDMS